MGAVKGVSFLIICGVAPPPARDLGQGINRLQPTGPFFLSFFSFDAESFKDYVFIPPFLPIMLNTVIVIGHALKLQNWRLQRRCLRAASRGHLDV